MKTVLANVVALLLMGVVSLLFFYFLILKRSEPKDIQDQSVLVINLRMNVVDSPQKVELEEVPTYSLLEFTSAIEQATRDERIVGLYLYGSLVPSHYGSSYAVLREMRASIQRFQERGKPVIAYLQNPTLRDFYFTSVSDHLILHPMGILSLHEFSDEEGYLSGKTQLRETLWGEILKDIAVAREMDTLREKTEKIGFFSAQEALEAHLVDQVAYFDVVLEELDDLAPYDSLLDTFRQVSLEDYIAKEGPFPLSSTRASSTISVIYAEGEIVDGEGNLYQVGGDRLARELRQLRQEENVAGVVLRVNSPGGNALASDIIRREMRLLKESKPVVVSMGSLATGGGYLISAYADYLFAEPTTITGAIGVWSVFGKLPEIPLPERFVEQRYQEFVYKVAEARQLDAGYVESLAKGAIYAGVEAKEMQLVDELGGLREAIAHVVRVTQLEEWQLKQVPSRLDD